MDVIISVRLQLPSYASIIAQLPEGFRPAQENAYPGIYQKIEGNAKAPCTFTIKTDGSISVNPDGTQYSDFVGKDGWLILSTRVFI